MLASSLKKLTATAALAGLLIVGGAAVASAAPAEPGSGPAACDRVPELRERIVTVHERAHDRYGKLIAARAKAEAAGRTELVAKIDARLATLRDRHAKLHDRYAAAKDKIKEHCGADLAPLPADELG